MDNLSCPHCGDFKTKTMGEDKWKILRVLSIPFLIILGCAVVSIFCFLIFVFSEEQNLGVFVIPLTLVALIGFILATVYRRFKPKPSIMECGICGYKWDIQKTTSSQSDIKQKDDINSVPPEQ